MRKKFAPLIALTLVSIVCLGHEFILLAEQYRLRRGDELIAHLLVADGFNIESERPFRRSVNKAFRLYSAGRAEDLLPDDGTYPVVKKKTDFDGGGLIYMERDYARISLPTKKFFEYLKEDHLDGIAGLVDKSKKEQRERYTRYIKCLVQSGEQKTDSVYKTVTAGELEILLLQNPYALKPGNYLEAKILFRGQPLTGKMITSRFRRGSLPVVTQTSRTNDKGICGFRLIARGEMFIHCTHMIVCKQPADADWESFWASFSFEIA